MLHANVPRNVNRTLGWNWVKSIEHMFSGRLGNINNLVSISKKANISALIATFSMTKWIWKPICFMRERKIGPIVGYVALKFIAPQSQAP
jgi:hypothetical protein